MCFRVGVMDFASFCDLDILFWNCSDGLVFFVFLFFTYMYIIYVATYKWKFHNVEIEIISCHLSFSLTSKHCQFRGVVQGVNQTELYLLWPSFQVQWDRFDQVGDGHEILY
jgi:hypothetical protein